MAAEFNPQFQKIGEILVHAGKIDENKLNSALAEQKKSNEKIGQVLISMGAIDEDDFITAFSIIFFRVNSYQLRIQLQRKLEQ